MNPTCVYVEVGYISNDKVLIINDKIMMKLKEI